jgi:drug/metabolite transporter (DMT)-like permease
MSIYTIFGLFAVLIWSAGVGVSGVLVDYFGALTAVTYELFIGGSILTTISLFRGEVVLIKKHPLKYLIIGGIFWILNQVLFWIALGKVTSNEERVVLGLINYLWPALIIIFSLFIIGKKSNRFLWSGLVLAILGIIISKIAISGKLHLNLDANTIKAYFLMLLVAISFAIYSNLSTKYADPKGSSPIFLFMLLTSIILFFAYDIKLPTDLSYTNKYLVLIIWSAFTSIAYLGWDVSMRKGNQTLVASAALLIPFFSTIITALLNSISINIYIIISGVMVSVGAWMARRGVK